MNRVGRWLNRGPSAAEPASLDVVSQAESMQSAIVAADMIMNDNISGAEEELAKGDSAFHKLAKGTISFLKATLGFEQEHMKEAYDLLLEAENSAHAIHQKALHDTSLASSTIYGRGSAFALCQAEAQIMSAVVGILNESLTESIKGFYKMRKAYMTLESLAKMEADFVKIQGLERLRVANQSDDSFKSAMSENLDDKAESTKGTNLEATTEAGNGPMSDKLPSSLTPIVTETKLLKDPTPIPSGATTPILQTGVVTPVNELSLVSSIGLLNADSNSPLFANPLDAIIHSGVNIMSGIVNLLLSVVPPTFGRILSVVGFRGNREKGLRMLWQASKFPNIHGGLAALILFMWYNGITGFCDIISEADPKNPQDVNGIPSARLDELLQAMRQRYPGSIVWILEEARGLSSRRQIHKALELLNAPHKTEMKQLKALHAFERSLDYLNSHQYKLCAESFLECIDLNGWSPALYYYTAAASYLQLYRDAKTESNQEAMKEYAELADKHFTHAPTCIAKKKLMGRQLPLDTFVARKLAKWTERSKQWDCGLIDAVGVAPLEELMLVWNGFKRMDESQLNKSLQNLTWLEKNSPHWAKEEENEKAIMTVLQATALRHLRRHDESKVLLREKVLSYDASKFRGAHHDNWVGPAGNYEMATNFWMERREYIQRYGTGLATLASDHGAVVADADIKHDATLVAEAKKYVEKAKNWGSYDLDSRIGIKVTAAHGAITRWEAQHADVLAKA